MKNESIKCHTMKGLPISERPYEKVLNYGPKVLSDAELIAVVLKTGTKDKTSLDIAREILTMNTSYYGLIGLYHQSIEELKTIDGIGDVKAVTIVCMAELAKRLARVSRTEHLRVFTDPGEVAGFFMEEMRSLETEHVYAMFLDTSGHMLKHEKLFKGSIAQALVNPREILRAALRADAAQFVILHNHPSGDPRPSPEDIVSTKQLKKSAKLIGIPLADHIIIGDRVYTSLALAGLI